LELHGNIPTFIRISDGKVHDVNILGEISPEAGAFYVIGLSETVLSLGGVVLLRLPGYFGHFLQLVRFDRVAAL
jgi:hypothetical protein